MRAPLDLEARRCMNDEAATTGDGAAEQSPARAGGGSVGAPGGRHDAGCTHRQQQCATHCFERHIGGLRVYILLRNHSPETSTQVLGLTGQDTHRGEVNVCVLALSVV